VWFSTGPCSFPSSTLAPPWTIFFTVSLDVARFFSFSHRIFLLWEVFSPLQLFPCLFFNLWQVRPHIGTSPFALELPPLHQGVLHSPPRRYAIPWPALPCVMALFLLLSPSLLIKPPARAGVSNGKASYFFQARIDPVYPSLSLPSKHFPFLRVRSSPIPLRGRRTFAFSPEAILPLSATSRYGILSFLLRRRGVCPCFLGVIQVS